MGVAKRTVDIHRLKAFFAKVYSLQMQVEQWGPSMAVLEAVLILVDRGSALTLPLRRRGEEAKTDPRRATLGYVDWFSPNARSDLQSRVPMIAQKCTFYASHTPIIKENVRFMINELTEARYACTW